MAFYDIDGNQIVFPSNGTSDEEQAIISASGFNTNSGNSVSDAVAYKKNLTFAVISDIHGTGDALNDFVEYINGKSDYLDFAICLGDNVPIRGDTATAWYDSALQNSNIPVYAVVGNHDVRFVNLSTALGKLFATPKAKGWMAQSDFGSSSNGYWYKDFADYKIRIIGLMEFDNADLLKNNSTNSEKRWLDTAQLQWFADTLYSTPTDYTVVLFTHQALENATVIEHPFTRIDGFTNDTLTAIDGEPIGELITAFKTGANISKTYSPTSSMASLINKTATVAKDFSARGTGKFACHICGHTHASRLVTYNTYNTLKGVFVPSGSRSVYQRQWDDINYSANGGQNNFYIISINTTKNKVNLVKVGNHTTIDMNERYFGSMSY